jgi:putative PIN family toxin of toxin-antitoxin system
VSKTLRAVVDPNVLVAAAIKPTGTCRQLLDAAVEQRWLPVISSQLLDELEVVLRRPKFASKLTDEIIGDFIASLASASEITADPPSPAPHTPDPDDDYLVALALAADVDVLISGDTDLTDLTDCEIPVQTPRDFLDRISEQSPAE